MKIYTNNELEELDDEALESTIGEAKRYFQSVSNKDSPEAGLAFLYVRAIAAVKESRRKAARQTEINGRDLSKGLKFDSGKRRLSLVPISCINAILDVLEFGAKKYGVDNWQQVPQAETRYFDAAIRHLFAWREGEKIDPESGCHHLAHAACCVIFLLWFSIKEKVSK